MISKNKEIINSHNVVISDAISINEIKELKISSLSKDLQDELVSYLEEIYKLKFNKLEKKFIFL